MAQIKLENIFKKIEQLVKKIFTNRFLLYRSVGLLLVVATLVGGYFLWHMYRKSETAEAGWYQDGWTRRNKLTINASQVLADETDFPLVISTTSAEFLNYASSTGADFLFTDISGTKLNHEIEKYSSTTGELVAWVKVPSISSTTDTILYMYYGNPRAEDQQTALGVWGENYAGVWHMPDNGPASTSDSTLYGNDGGIVDGADNATTTDAGKLDGAFSFDGSHDHIEVPDADSLDVTTITLEAWIKSGTTTTKTLYILGKEK